MNMPIFCVLDVCTTTLGPASSAIIYSSSATYVRHKGGSKKQTNGGGMEECIKSALKIKYIKGRLFRVHTILIAISSIKLFGFTWIKYQ